MTLNEIIEKKKEELDEKWSTDEVGENDYGCDGADECCGNCGGWKADSEKIKSFLEKAIRESVAEALQEVIPSGYYYGVSLVELNKKVQEFMK